MVQDYVHDAEELLNTLVLAQIFTALHKKWILFLIVTTDYQALGTPDGGHDFDLRQKDHQKCSKITASHTEC